MEQQDLIAAASLLSQQGVPIPKRGRPKKKIEKSVKEREHEVDVSAAVVEPSVLLSLKERTTRSGLRALCNPVKVVPKEVEKRVATRHSWKKIKKQEGVLNESALCYSTEDLNFIGHVVHIWLERATRNDKNIFMPDSILKAKAKDVAQILKKDGRFLPMSWTVDFKTKMEQNDFRKSVPPVSGYPSMIIADIVREEYQNFFDGGLISDLDLPIIESSDDESSIMTINTIQQVKCNDVMCCSRIQTNEVVKEEAIEVDIDSQTDEVMVSDDVLFRPIETIDEAFDCLRLLENYVIEGRNVTAMGLICEIEKILADDQSI